MNFLTYLYKRFNFESPLFFKRLTDFGVLLGSIGGSILLSKMEYNYPEWLLILADRMVIVGAVTAIVAKFTVKDTSELEND